MRRAILATIAVYVGFPLAMVGCTKAQGTALVTSLPTVATAAACVILDALDGMALTPIAAACGTSVEQAGADILAIVDGSVSGDVPSSTTRTRLEMSAAYAEAKIKAKP